jgi:hypothetical protein
MRRWFTILLLVFLPLQASWAAAGSYCQHETGIQAQHFGHHEHRHLDASHHDEKIKSAKPVLAADADCSFCHPCCGAVLVDAPSTPELTVAANDNTPHLRPLLSAILSPPDRPNWSRLV